MGAEVQPAPAPLQRSRLSAPDASQTAQVDTADKQADDTLVDA